MHILFHAIALAGLFQAPPSPSVTLTWVPTVANDPAVSMVVERTVTGAGQWVPIVSVPIATTTYTDIDVVYGVSYNYRVIEEDASNNQSAPSNTLIENVQPHPGTPTNLTGVIN